MADRYELNVVLDGENKIGPAAAEFVSEVEAMEKSLDRLDKQVNIPVELKAENIDREIAAIEAELKRLEKGASIQVDVDTRRAQQQLRDLERQLQNLSRNSANIRVTADTRRAESQLRDVRRDAEQLGRLKPTISVEVNAGPARVQLENIQRQAEQLNRLRVSIQVDVDSAAARAQIDAIANQARQLGSLNPTIKIDVDASAAMAQMAVVLALAQTIAQQSPTVKIDVDASTAITQLTVVTVESATAAAGLTTAGASAAAASGGFNSMGVSMFFTAAAAGAIVAAVAVAVGAIASLVGILLVAAAAAAAFAGGIALVAAPIALLVSQATAAQEAVKGQGSAMDQGAAQAQQYESAVQGLEDAQRQLGEAHAQAARSISDAEQQVADAYRQAEESATDSAQQIADAQRDAARAAEDSARSIDDAYRDAARAAEDSAQSIEDAQRGVERAVEASSEQQTEALRAVADAEKQRGEVARDVAQQVRDAQDRYLQSVQAVRDQELALQRAREDQSRVARDLTDAQRTLNQAMREEPDRVLSTELDLQQARLDQKRTALDLAEGEKRLSEARKSGDALRVQSAELSLEQTRLNQQKGAVSLRDAERQLGETRSQGSSQLQSATKGVESASLAEQRSRQGVADAEKQLGNARQDQSKAYQGIVKTQQDGAKRIQDAEQGVTRAQEQAAKAQRDGARSVEDAQRSLQRTTQQSARSQEDAQRGIARAVQQASRQQEDSQRSVARAQEQATRQQENSARQIERAVQQSARTQEDAQKRVADAERQVARAADQVAKASQKMGQDQAGAAQQAKGLFSALEAMIPGLARLRAAFTQAFAPSTEQVKIMAGQVANLGTSIMPALGVASQRSLRLVQEGFQRSAATAGYTEQNSFSRILDGIPLLMGNASFAAGNFGQGFLNIMGQAMPHAEAFSQKIAEWSTRFLEYTRTAEGQKFVDELMTNGAKLADALAQAFGGVTMAVLKMGNEHADQIASMIIGVGKMVEAVVWLIGKFLDVVDAIAKVGKVAVDVAKEIVDWWTWMANKLHDVGEKIGTSTADRFAALKDTLVGNSIVPDMVREIVGEFEKMNVESGGKVEQLAKKVVGHFEVAAKMSQEHIKGLKAGADEALKAGPAQSERQQRDTGPSANPAAQQRRPEEELRQTADQGQVHLRRLHNAMDKEGADASKKLLGHFTNTRTRGLKDLDDLQKIGAKSVGKLREDSEKETQSLEKNSTESSYRMRDQIVKSLTDTQIQGVAQFLQLNTLGSDNMLKLQTYATDQNIMMGVNALKSHTDMQTKGTEQFTTLQENGTDQFTTLQENGTDQFTTMQTNGSKQSEDLRKNATDSTTTMNRDSVSQMTDMQTQGTNQFSTLNTNGTQSSNAMNRDVTTYMTSTRDNTTQLLTETQQNGSSQLESLRSKGSESMKAADPEWRQPVGNASSGIQKYLNDMLYGMAAVIDAASLKLTKPEQFEVRLTGGANAFAGGGVSGVTGNQMDEKELQHQMKQGTVSFDQGKGGKAPPGKSYLHWWGEGSNAQDTEYYMVHGKQENIPVLQEAANSVDMDVVPKDTMKDKDRGEHYHLPLGKRQGVNHPLRAMAEGGILRRFEDGGGLGPTMWEDMWTERTAEIARQTEAATGGVPNTYSNHPLFDPTRAPYSIDFWGDYGRGDPIPTERGDQVLAYLLDHFLSEFSYWIWNGADSYDGSIAAEEGHYDHVHSTFMPGLNLMGAGGGAGGPSIAPLIQENFPAEQDFGSALYEQEATEIGKTSREAMIKELSKSKGPGTAFSGGGTQEANRELGMRMNAAMGWDAMFDSLDQLWIHESQWDHLAENPESGAYGIPQALPGDKMASSGSDWRTNPATQIDWGLGYIAERYGDPDGAWSAWNTQGWYAGGGVALGPQLAEVGINSPELFMPLNDPTVAKQFVDLIGQVSEDGSGKGDRKSIKLLDDIFDKSKLTQEDTRKIYDLSKDAGHLFQEQRRLQQDIEKNTQRETVALTQIGRILIVQTGLLKQIAANTAGMGAAGGASLGGEMGGEGAGFSDAGLSSGGSSDLTGMEGMATGASGRTTGGWSRSQNTSGSSADINLSKSFTGSGTQASVQYQNTGQGNIIIDPRQTVNGVDTIGQQSQDQKKTANATGQVAKNTSRIPTTAQNRTQTVSAQQSARFGGQTAKSNSQIAGSNKSIAGTSAKTAGSASATAGSSGTTAGNTGAMVGTQQTLVGQGMSEMALLAQIAANTAACAAALGGGAGMAGGTTGYGSSSGYAAGGGDISGSSTYSDGGGYGVAPAAGGAGGFSSTFSGTGYQPIDYSGPGLEVHGFQAGNQENYSNSEYQTFAWGGMVNAPMSGIVGEAGPELIVPLSDQRAASDFATFLGNVAEETGPRRGGAPVLSGGGDDGVGRLEKRMASLEESFGRAISDQTDRLESATLSPTELTENSTRRLGQEQRGQTERVLDSPTGDRIRYGRDSIDNRLRKWGTSGLKN